MFHNDALRGPVWSYGEALSWLFKHSRVEDWAFDEGCLIPKEAQLVCDMYWVNSEKLLHDLRKLWNETVNPAPARAPYRRERFAGWR